MALLATTPLKAQGVPVTLVAASVGGDTVNPGDHTFVEVNNAAVASTTVTIETPGNDQFGQAIADIPVVVAAGARIAIGPLDRKFADPADGKVHLSYSSVTTLTVGAFAS